MWLGAVSALTIAAEPEKSGARVENPFRGVMQDRSARSPSEALFVEKCGMCHRQMGMGTVLLARRMEPQLAMLEARTDLSRELLAVAVRLGIGNMPRIGRGELSDAELEIITNYLVKPQ
jgi:cytochrome c553